MPDLAFTVALSDHEVESVAKYQGKTNARPVKFVDRRYRARTITCLGFTETAIEDKTHLGTIRFTRNKRERLDALAFQALAKLIETNRI